MSTSQIFGGDCLVVIARGWHVERVPMTSGDALCAAGCLERGVR